MIKEILPSVFLIEIPLPKNPLRVLNSYLFRGDGRNLLVDTGFNLQECWAVMESSLQQLQVSMDDTDLFLTHAHSDHAGLVEYLTRPANRILMSQQDVYILEAGLKDHRFLEAAAQHLRQSGLLAAGVPYTPQEEAVVKYASHKAVNLTQLREGDLLSVGAYHFRCIETPGHTPGHMCLYEPERKMLVAGDHILATITPNIGLWVVNRDALGEYLQSLDKVADLDVELVLPGHRNLIRDMRARIAEIKEHHRQRLDNVLSLVGNKRMTAAQAAAGMKWDLTFKSWDEFPFNQKLHAAAEAMAHLYHLVIQGQLAMSCEEGIYYFQLA
ncbi:MAG: MBL fold metallo-hydrolase [Syntrophomonas sp.]|nr:MBL fold metallo-hydrolase [Syntrophomonas sp.]